MAIEAFSMVQIPADKPKLDAYEKHREVHEG